MNFVRTSQDAETHNLDACCGNFVSASPLDTNLPEDEKSGGVVYCYAKCSNCGAVWRDGFRSGHVTEYVYDGIGNPPFQLSEYEYTYSHIDTNKLHDGRAIAVYHPEKHPADVYKENGWEDAETIQEWRDTYDRTDFRKEVTYVYRFSEVDGRSVSPITTGTTVEYCPDPDENSRWGITLVVDDLSFTDEYVLEEIVCEVRSASLYAGHTDLEAGDEIRFDTVEFEKLCTVTDDPFEGVLSHRPKMR